MSCRKKYFMKKSLPWAKHTQIGDGRKVRVVKVGRGWSIGALLQFHPLPNLGWISTRQLLWNLFIVFIVFIPIIVCKIIQNIHVYNESAWYPAWANLKVHFFLVSWSHTLLHYLYWCITPMVYPLQVCIGVFSALQWPLLRTLYGDDTTKYHVTWPDPVLQVYKKKAWVKFLGKAEPS